MPLGTKDPALLAAGYHAGYDRKDLKQGIIPDVSDGAKRTRDYAREVAARAGGSAPAGKVASADSAAPAPPSIPSLQSALDAQEPGRYEVLADPGADVLTRLNTGDDKDRYELASPDEISRFEAGKKESVGDAAKSFLGKSLKAGMYDLAGAGAKLLDAVNPWTLSESDAATLFKNDPAKLKDYQDNSVAMILSRFARRMSHNSEDAMKEISPGAELRYGHKEYATTDLDKAAYASPVKVIGDVVRNLPTQVGLAISAYLTRGAAAQAEAQALKAGLTAEAAKQAAIQAGAKTMATMGAVSEGAIGYAQQASQAREEAEKVKQADLEKSPEYQKLLANGYTPETAKQKLAAVTAEQAGVVAGVVDAAVNKVGGHFLGKIMTEGGKFVPRVMKGFVNEGATEAIQSPGEQYAQNAAVKRNINPNQDLSEGVLENAVQGLVVGGVSGGGFAGAMGRGHSANSAAPNNAAPAVPAAPAAPENQAPAAPAAPAAAAPVAPVAEPAAPAGPIERAVGKVVPESKQVVGDDGTVYNVKVGDSGVEVAAIDPAAQAAPALTEREKALQEIGDKAASEKPPKPEPAPKKEQEPAAKVEEAKSASDEEPAAKAPAGPTDTRAPAGADLSTMDEPALRERMKYLAGQAKRTGGWDKMLVTERKRVEAEIGKRKNGQPAAQVEQAAEPAPEKTASGAFVKQSDANDAMRTAARDTGKPHQVVEREEAGRAVFDVRPMEEANGANARRAEPAGAPVTAAEQASAAPAAPAAERPARAAKTAPTAGEPGAAAGEATAEPAALTVKAASGKVYPTKGERLPKAGVVPANLGNDGIVYVGRPNSLHFHVADRHSKAAGGFSDTGFVTPDGQYLTREEALAWVNTHEAKVKPSENMGASLDAIDYREQVPESKRKAPEAAEDTAATPAAAPAEAVKWFGTREKAEAHIAKNGIADTHEVVQAQNRRFEIHPKVADGFERFAPETGTLGIPRAEMPQVPSQSHGALVNHLNAQGIEHETKMVPADELKPTQAEFSPEKVEQAKEANGDRAVIVSSDGHIIDGHHQALAAKDEGKDVKAIVLDAPVDQALEAVKNSPSAQSEQPAEAAPARPKRLLGDAKVGDTFTPSGDIGYASGGHELKPTQAEFSPEKVEQAKEANGDRAVIVSSDGHIIDGHHQALAAKDEGKDVKAIVLDAPVDQALEAVKNSPSAQSEQPAEAAPARPKRLLGDAKVGDTFTPSGDIGYASGGQTYRVESVDRKGGITVRNVATGSGTTISRAELMGAERKGVTVEKQQADAAPADQPAAPANESLFAGNKLFTEDKVEAARARMRRKLKSTAFTGLDPELVTDGMTIAGAYIEAGVREFGAYAKAMVEDFGAEVKPYLLSFYEAVRHFPGLETEGMTAPQEAGRLHAELLSQNETAQEAQHDTEANPARPGAGDEGQNAAAVRGDEGGRDAGRVSEPADGGRAGVADRGAQRAGERSAVPEDQRSADAHAGSEQPAEGSRERGDRAGGRADQQPASAAANHRIHPGDLKREGSWKDAAERAFVQDRDFNPKAKKEGGLYVSDDGRLMQVEDGAGADLTHRLNSDGKRIELKPKERAWLRGWVSLRDALKQAQLDQLTDGDWQGSLQALNAAYDAFVKDHGNILAFSTIERENPDGTTSVTRRLKNAPLMTIDAEGALAHALERINEDGTISKGAVLQDRVLKRPTEPVINTTQDAMFVALDRHGKFDLDTVARLAGQSREQVSADAAAATVETEGGEDGPRYSVAPEVDRDQSVEVTSIKTFDVPPEQLYETAKAFYQENLRGASVNNQWIGKVEFNKEGGGKLLSVGRREPLHMSVVQALPGLLKSAVPVRFEQDRKGRQHIDGYFAAIAPVDIDGTLYSVELKLRKLDKSGGGRTTFYTLAGFEVEKVGGGRANPEIANHGRPSTASQPSEGYAAAAVSKHGTATAPRRALTVGELLDAVNWEQRSFSVSPSPAGGEVESRRPAAIVNQTIANANGINVTELSMALRDSNVGDLIGRLLDHGRVVLHDDAGSLPGKNAPRGVQASTMPDGTIHMVGANLNTQSAVPVLLHEMFHSGVKPLVGEAAWGKLMTRLDGLLRQSERSTGRAREFYDAAFKRMRAAAHAGDARVMNAEEFGAYAIEEYSGAPAAVRAWVDDVVGAIKAWLLRRLGTQIGAVTPAQLRALAVAALRSEPRADGDAPRNSVKAPMNPVEAGLTPPAPTRFDRFQAAVQDNMNRVKQVQERIKKLTGLKELGFSDYYRAEANRPGRVAARLEDAQKRLTGPLMERLAKSGHTPAQLEELLHAQHAEERNEKIAEINKDMPDGGSGMMTAEANAILEKYKGATELKAIAQQARDIARATLDLKLAYGLIDQTTHDTLSTGYENYVPLKGDGEYGPKIKRAMGHEERAEQILENIARDYDQAVAAGEKNIARQSLLALVAEHEDPSLWTIGIPPRGRRIAGQVFNVVDPSLPKGQQTIGSFSARSQVDAFLEGAGPKAASYLVLDSGGERVQQFVRPLQDNEVMVYVKGEPVRIQIYDEALARQLRPLDQSKMHPILEFMRGMNRYLSKIYTGYNPAFILRNAARDALTGTVNMVGHEGAGVAAKAWAKYPGAVKALGQWAATGNAPAGNTGEYLKEYRMHGGKTGASWMSDLEAKGKELSRMYEDAYGASGYLKDGQNLKAAKVAGRKIVGGMAHVVEIANQATENALRLSLYMTLRESGASPGKAAQAAKSVTVDFDRKGTMTGALGAVYLFLNPAVQGTANAMRTLASGEHRGQAFAALGMLATLGFYAAASGMDDDKDRWLGEGWDGRTKNFVMMFGDHTLKVPLSQEFTPAYAFGVALAEAMRGEGAMKSSVRMVSSFLDAYFPLNGAYNPDSDNHLLDAAQAASPTIIKPLVETAVNRNHFGSPIVPETPATKSQPDNLKMYRGTKGTVYDALAQQIAAAGELTGAGRYENDITKISPETLKSVWRTYTGGLGQFVADSIGAASLATEPGEMSSNDIPIAKDFWRAQDVKPIRSRYYDLAREAKEAATEFQQAKKAGDGEAIDSIFARPGQAELIALDKMFKKSSHAAAAIRDEEVTVNADKSLSTAEKRNRLKELEKQEESIYRDALDVFKTSIPSK
ncbi:DarB-like antirestriction protein [Ralstonia phage RPZH3]|nr:DarB-like antirestriction protein [Ralstonia phage RPZH3]